MHASGLNIIVCMAAGCAGSASCPAWPWFPLGASLGGASRTG